jgi:hypothetical protein
LDQTKAPSNTDSTTRTKSGSLSKTTDSTSTASAIP